MALALISAYAQAQKPAVMNGPNVVNQAVRVNDATAPSPVRTSGSTGFTTKTLGKKSFATKVGETQNDQQTNASVYRHIQLLSGGKVSITWTTSSDPAPYTTRGSGYNHFNGTTWGAVNSLRIDPERSGFPCYVYNPTTNEEIITSHIVKVGTGNAGGLLMNRKTGVGAGTWTTTTVLDTIATVPGVLWAQTAVSGDYLIVMASYTDSSSTQPNRVVKNGVRTPQVYSRYQFSTNTWLVKNECLPGYDGTRTYSGGGDNYSIDAVGNTVAILLGGSTDDLTLYKSTDNGGTWTKTIIDSFPIPRFDGASLLDTTETNDGSVHVMLDNNGVAHCFWARNRVLDTDPTDNNWSFFPGTNGIMHWADNTPFSDAQVIGGMVDENNNGGLDLQTGTTAVGARYGNNTLATMPYAAMDDKGIIYVVFSAPTEDDISTDSKNFRDIYIVTSKDGGVTWSGIKNLTSWLGLNNEQVFGSLSKKMDGRLHMTFLQKASVGRYDATNNPGAAGTHDVMYMAIDTADIFGTLTSIGEVKLNNELFTIGQNYPNPVLNSTTIPVNFKQAADVKITVIDLMGKVVFEGSYENIPAGSSQLDLSLNNLSAGVYVYTVEANGFKTSRRMLVD